MRPSSTGSTLWHLSGAALPAPRSPRSTPGRWSSTPTTRLRWRPWGVSPWRTVAPRRRGDTTSARRQPTRATPSRGAEPPSSRLRPGIARRPSVVSRRCSSTSPTMAGRRRAWPRSCWSAARGSSGHGPWRDGRGASSAARRPTPCWSRPIYRRARPGRRWGCSARRPNGGRATRRCATSSAAPWPRRGSPRRLARRSSRRSPTESSRSGPRRRRLSPRSRPRAADGSGGHGPVTRRVGLAIGSLALAVAAFALGTRVATRGWPDLALGERPGSRVRAALGELDPLARTAALVPVLRGLRPEDLDEVVAAYEATLRGVGPGGAAIELLCEAWAALDPRGALERIGRWPAERRSEGVRACLRSWARREPRAAYEWTASGVEPEARQAVFSGWAESGDPAMWDFVARMTPSMDREIASNVLMMWVMARGGVDDLLARVEALPDDAPGRFKLAAFRTATGLAAYLDPELALAFVDRHAGGPYDKGLLKRLAVRQLPRDGPGTMQMLLDRPAGTERDWALRETYRRWLVTDREAALSWMPEAAASDPRFLPLCDIYAVALAQIDPEH